MSVGTTPLTGHVPLVYMTGENVKSSYEQLEPTRVKIAVEVPFEDFKPQIDKAAKEIGNQVQIPGFRRGHVPARVLEAQFGRGAIVEQAINDSMDDYYRVALEENKLTPLGRPEVTDIEGPYEKGEDKPLTFNVTVDVRPEIVIPNPADMTFTVENAVDTEKAAEERLVALQERFATLKDVEREAGEKDTVTIDLVATIDGEEVDSASGISYRIGDGNMLDGLDDAIMGKKAGETVTFTTKLAGGEHEGKDADVTVTVNKVQESELPEADDDFAQEASEFDTIEELREDLAKKAKEAAIQAQATQARSLMLEKFREVIDVPLSDRIINAQVDAHLESEGKEGDLEHAKDIRDDLANGLREQIILDVLTEKFGINVEQDELFNFMIQQSQMYGMDPQQFISLVAQRNEIPAFANQLRQGKALIAALRYTNVVDKDGNKVDIIAAVGEKPENELVPEFGVATAKPVAKPAKKAAAKNDAGEKEADKASNTGDFDPSTKKVDEVLAYAESADKAEVARVLEAEKAGKGRKTLISKLEALA